MWGLVFIKVQILYPATKRLATTLQLISCSVWQLHLKISCNTPGRVAKLADAWDLKSQGLIIRAGSSPALATTALLVTFQLLSWLVMPLYLGRRQRWRAAADCKSVVLRLSRFESYPSHHAFRIGVTGNTSHFDCEEFTFEPWILSHMLLL